MYNNFNTIYSLAQTLYGVTMNPSEFEDICLNGWEKIGNKHSKLHRYKASTVNKELELPCNITELESVHIPMLDSQLTTNHTIQHQYNTLYIENYIEAWKTKNNPIYQRGQLVDYRLENNTLVFDSDYNDVVVVYHGIIVDDEGLPLLSDKEVDALALYLAYSSKYRDALVKNDGNLYQLASAMKADWLRQCNNARVPDKISQNDMNAILDVKTRWDRKQYGKSFKHIL